MRIAVIDKSLCKPEKCSHECAKVCPINRAGEKCVVILDKSSIDEQLCIGCGLCIKACPFEAIMIVNTPEKLKERPVHRFGKNGFTLFRLPFPMKGEVIGLLGPNGVGKTTALKILAGDIKPNLGEEREADIKELTKMYRGTELQSYLDSLGEGKLKTVIKPQHIDILRGVKGTVNDILEKHNERGEKDRVVMKLDLGHVLDRKLDQLSGGELQRVAIAVAVNRKADILYIDEPSSYLDVYQRLQVAKLLRELAKDTNVMVVEHDLATLDLLADRIHIFYGVPGAYGVVSKPYSTRVGINTFLEGYIKEDNVRFRPDKMKFEISKLASASRDEKYLEWSDITKRFKGFSLELSAGDVYKGEILGIFGANALGKTTFARMLAGETRPDSGGITRSVKISYKAQYLSSDFDGTVSELLRTAAESVHREDYKAGILRPLSLERLLERKVSELSGGELQRVSVALCMSREADIYLLDEPSAFLDSEQRLAAAKMIRKLCEVRECSAMVIDHDLLFLSYLSDRAMLFTGKPSTEGRGELLPLEDGFNRFLKEADVTFRREPTTGRPRANKPGSQKDEEQKAKGKYFLG